MRRRGRRQRDAELSELCRRHTSRYVSRALDSGAGKSAGIGSLRCLMEPSMQRCLEPDARRSIVRAAFSLALLCVGLAHLHARAGEPPDWAKVTQEFGPAVVNVSTSGMRQVSAGDAEGAAASSPDADADAMQEFLRSFQKQFGATGVSMQVPVRAMGSGFVLEED